MNSQSMSPSEMSKSVECDKEHQACNKVDVGMLVVICLIAPVVTTTFIILSYNKIKNKMETFRYQLMRKWPLKQKG